MNPPKRLKTDAGPSTLLPSATDTTLVPGTSASADQSGPTSGPPSNSAAPQLHSVFEVKSTNQAPPETPHYRGCDAETKGSSECGCLARWESERGETNPTSSSNPTQAGRLNHATAGLSASQAEVPDQVSGQRHAHRPPRANAVYAAASNNTALPPNAMAMSHGVKRPAPESVSNDTAQASLPSTQTQTGHVNELYDPITVAKAKHSTTSGDKQSSEYWALVKGRRQGVYYGRYYDVEQCFIFFNNDIKGFPTEAQARKHFWDRSNGKEAPATIYVKPDEEIISNEEFLSTGSRNLFRRLEEQRSTASDAAHIPTAPSAAQTTAASTSTIGTAPPSARLPTAASAASAPTTTGSAAATTPAAKAPTARAPTARAPTATAPTATAPTATAPVTTVPTTAAPHVPDQRVHLPAQTSIDPPVSELVRNLQQSLPKSLSSGTRQQVVEQFVAGLA